MPCEFPNTINGKIEITRGRTTYKIVYESFALTFHCRVKNLLSQLFLSGHFSADSLTVCSLSLPLAFSRPVFHISL